MSDSLKEEEWIEDLGKNTEFKESFLKGLQRLGFPLEFKIRKKLVDLGFENVQEGHFSTKEDRKEVIKTFDISARKLKTVKIKNNVSIVMGLQLIGDCKSTLDPKKFLLAIPESGDLKNKVFVGPILSNLQFANYGAYRNIVVASNFLSKYGEIFLASDVKDTSKEFIMGTNQNDKNIPDNERIYAVCENTIIPAISEQFGFWQNSAINDYDRILSRFSEDRFSEDRFSEELLQNESFGFEILIPIIITTKPILMPVIEKGELKDIQEWGYFAYSHSLLRPEKYSCMVSNSYNLLIFICNEKYFNNLMDYIHRLSETIFSEVSGNCNRNLRIFYTDSKEVLKQRAGVR